MLKLVFDLIGGIKGVALIALTIALAGWAWNMKRDVEQAELARDQAIAQRDAAGIQRDKAIAAAKTNDETVKRLEDEKRDINSALNALAEAREGNRSNTVTREIIIQEQSGVAANSAVAAPVLGTIIAEVQDDRVRRRSK